MKHFFFLFWVIILFTSQKSSAQLKANGIYFSDSDFLKRDLSHGFDETSKNKTLNAKRNSIWIKIDSTNDQFYYDEIWGFRKRGIDWRIYNGEFYKVDFVGKICIYTLQAGRPLETSSSVHFSYNLKSPIYYLSRHNLIVVFHDNAALIKKVKDLPLTQSIYKWDNVNKYYLFINWL